MQQYKEISVIFSEDCNLNCPYCYLPTFCRNHNENEILREKIKSGEYQSLIIEKLSNYRESIENISFWGAESTLNLDLIDTFLTPLLEYFVNIKEIFFPTNGLLTPQPLIDYLSKQDKKYELTFLFSLNGENEFNANRFSTEQQVLNQITSIVINNQNINNLNIVITISCVLSQNEIKQMQDKTSIEKYFNYFKQQNDLINSLNTNKNIVIDLTPYPAFVHPGEYTNQDGKNFASFLKIGFEKMFHFSSLIFFDGDTNPWCINEYNITIDKYGKIACCKKAYTMNENTCFLFDKDEKLSNYNFCKNNVAVLFNNYKAILEVLIMNKEIDKKYLTDPIYLESGFIVYMMIGCWIDSSIQTGSLFIPYIGTIKLICNGAIDYVIKYRKGEINGHLF